MSGPTCTYIHVSILMQRYAHFNVFHNVDNASAIIETDQMCIMPLNDPRRIHIVLENMQCNYTNA